MALIVATAEDVEALGKEIEIISGRIAQLEKVQEELIAELKEKFSEKK